MADACGGTLSRRDLRALRFGDAQIDWWLRVGLLTRVGRGEYRVAGSAFTTHQEVAAMVWRAGRGAHIAGGLGLGLLGIAGFQHVRDDHIAVPAPRRVTGVDFRVVSTVLDDCDTMRWQGLPMLTPERLFISAAATAHPARIRRGWDDARYKGLVSLDVFGQRAHALGRAHGAAQTRRILGDLDSESEPERDLLTVFRPGDPQPQAQVWVPWRGKWFRLDFAFLDARLDLEYDGSYHDKRREQDADRDLALKELEIDTIRVTKSMMRDPVDLRRRIMEIYRRRLRLRLPQLVPQTPPWLTA